MKTWAVRYDKWEMLKITLIAMNKKPIFVDFLSLIEFLQEYIICSDEGTNRPVHPFIII